MDNINLKEIDSLELLKVYDTLKDFIKYLETEKENTIKMGDKNE